jgi:hypothetical protein
MKNTKIFISILLMSLISSRATAENVNLPHLYQEQSLHLVVNDSNIQNNNLIYKVQSVNIRSVKPNNYITQITPSAPGKIPAAFSSLNLTNPTSPAAKLIGANDGKITTISTPDQFGLEVLNGLDNNGNFNTGVAVDTLPYVLIRGNGLTLEQYRESGIQRFLANTKLSIATTKASDSIGTARAGLGIEFVIINEGDPRLDAQFSQDLVAIQGKILDKVGEMGGPNATPQQLKEIAEAFNPDIQKAKARAEKRAGQKPMWTAAFGQSWVSPTGLYSDLRGEGMGFWTTYRVSMSDDAQLLLHASARNGERISDRKGGFINTDTLVGGVRLQSGNRDFRFSLETAYNRESQGGQRTNDYLSFGIGLEPRLFENSWLSLSFGGDTGRQSGTDFQFRTGIKWNINPGYLEK